MKENEDIERKWKRKKIKNWVKLKKNLIHWKAKFEKNDDKMWKWNNDSKWNEKLKKI